METIGDAYMCVSGLPNRNEHRHVLEIARVTLGFINVARSIRVSHLGSAYVLRIRGGMHSGTVATGVIGRHAPRYCLFGDTVRGAVHGE